MVKDSCSPGGDRVAGCASRSRDRESGGDVIGHRAANCGSALESCLVATVTIRRIESVVVVYMAGCAGRRSRGHVCSRQGKPGRAVVKSCRRPTYGRVARRQFATAKDGPDVE